MSVWTGIARVLNLRSSRFDPSRSLGIIPFRWVPTGLRVSTEEATSISAVWACIQAISNAVAASPWNVFEVRGRKRLYRPDDPLSFILNQRASEESTAIAWREAMLYGALAFGNAYAEIERDGSNRVIGLWPLIPENVQPERTDEGLLRYRYTDPGGNVLYYSPKEIYHLRGPVSVAGLMGDSTVGRATKAIALAAAAERFAISYLANGTIPTGVLTHPTKVSDDSMRKLRDQWTEKQAGPTKAGKPLLLEGGMKWESISADPDRAQLLQTQRWTVETISRYFCVPLVKIGVPEAAQWGANIEALNQEFYRTGLRPWALRLEQEANSKLLAPVPYRETEIDMEWMYRGSALDQANADAVRIKSGVWSVNEVRERIGDNTIGPEGDLRFIEGTLTPLTLTLLEIQELAAKEPEPAPVPGADPAGGTDTGADSEDEADPEDDPAEMMNAARKVIAGCMDRYGAKLRARKRALLAQAPDAADELLADERAKSLPEAVAEVRAALRLAGRTVETADIRLAFESVEAGALGRQAADHLWGLS